MQEAAQAIWENFPLTELQRWLGMPENQAVLHAHWMMGMWVRNQWIHRHPSAPLARDLEKYAPFGDPDKVSTFILHGVWRVLNGQDLQALTALPTWQPSPLSWD